MGARGNAALIAKLRALFAAHADAARAGPMQSYMKSALPFFGIAAPLRRRLMADAVREHAARTTAELAATMRSLFVHARRREEWYAAMELARTGASHRRLLTSELLPVYQDMIVGSAWWDVCDDISGTAIAGLLKSEPVVTKPVLHRWAHGDDLWLRRAAIIAQRRLREPDLDIALLYDAIEASLDDPRFKDEFFIRKAIGWALRERSYAAPGEVVRYCARQGPRLSALSRREALKAIRRRRDGAPPPAPD